MAIDIQAVIDDIRKNGTRLTPYRLGLEVGRRGLALESPYDAGSAAERLFQDGVNHAREQRDTKSE